MLRLRMTLFSGLTIPPNGLYVVLWNTFTIVIADTEVILRSCKTLLCSLVVPSYSLLVVLWNAIAIFIADTKVILCISIFLFGCFTA